MNTVSSSFRLPVKIKHFLATQAKIQKKSEAKIVEKALLEMMNRENQWEEDLKAIAKDDEYKNEQISLAEEHYED